MAIITIWQTAQQGKFQIYRNVDEKQLFSVQSDNVNTAAEHNWPAKLHRAKTAGHWAELGQMLTEYVPVTRQKYKLIFFRQKP